jgi:hypothetical protein
VSTELLLNDGRFEGLWGKKKFTDNIIIAVFKTLGTAATMQFFVHMPTPKVFGLFLNAISMDPLEPLAKSD